VVVVAMSGKLLTAAEIKVILQWWEEKRVHSPVGASEGEKKLAKMLYDYLGVTGSRDEEEEAPGPRNRPQYLRVRAIRDGYRKGLKNAEPGSWAMQAVQRYDAVADALESLLDVLSES
jgi:hypothetical protein